MAFIGVRISWLMLARKSDFMRVASSARVLAPPHLLHGGAFGADVVDDPDRALRWILVSTALPVSRAQKRLPSRRSNSCSRRWASPRQIAAYTGSPVAILASASGYQMVVGLPAICPSQPNISCSLWLQRMRMPSLISAMPKR